HHAVIDGWSESIFVSELVTTYANLLRNTPTELAKPALFAEYVRLERAARSDEDARGHFARLSSHVPDRRRRGRTAATLRKATATVSATDADGLARRSAEWGVPVKSLLLTACHATVGTLWTVEDPVIGLAVNGRPEVPGADLTLGLFLNHLPVRFERSGATWRAAAERALHAETELLPYRRFPYAEIRDLIGGEPFEVSLNYMRFHARDELLDAGLITAEEDMRDFTDLPARVEAFDDPRGLGLVLQATVDVDRHEADLPERIVRHMRAAIQAIVTEPHKEATIS
ncbi:MAG: condensation domain-containing protein, partial [Gemmatimonadales bacterium]